MIECGPGGTMSDTSSKPSRSKGRILIVDADPALRAAFEDVLGDEGYDVECASDVDEGRRAVRARAPYIIILDLGRHQQTSIEAWLNDLQRFRGGVFLTSTDRRDVAFAERFGLPFLRKPFDLAEFLALVDQQSEEPTRPSQRMPTAPPRGQS